MTRTDQILKTTAAMEGTLLNQGYSNQYAEAFADGFHEGAVWADANPIIKWHKCPNEKPPLNKLVLCYTTKGRYTTLCWIEQKLINGTIKGEGWEDNRYSNNIIAWTELPQPPKFD